MKKSVVVTIISLIAIVFGGFATAQMALAEQEKVGEYQRESQVYDRTIYRVGDRIVINDLVNGDLYCAGGRVLIDGVVNDDVLCTGGSVTIKGSVNGDVRVLAKDIVIDGEVAGNVSAVGANVRIGRAAIIRGDATIIAGQAEVSGEVARDVTVRADSVMVNGTIGRNLESYHTTMMIGPAAQVGSIVYSSPNTTQIPSTASVGDVTQITTNAPTYLSSLATGTVFLAALLYIAWFIALLLMALGVAFLFPKSLDDSVVFAQRQPWITILAGGLALIITPVVIGLLTVSIVGIPLAAIIASLFGAALLLSSPFVAHLLGALFFPERSHPVRSLFGAVLLLLLYMLPIINILTIIAVVIFGTGLVVRVATLRYSIAAQAYKKSKTSEPMVQS